MEIPSVIDLIIFILSALYFAIVVFFIQGWYKLVTYSPTIKQLNTKVSIIVAARNEELNISKTLEDLLAQCYDPSLTEIIFIDDHSTDRTSEIIRSYKDSGVRLIQLNEDKPLNSYKKKAIQTAIGASTGTLIITTDADCRMGRHWLRSIVSMYEEQKFKMISSPVVYFEEVSLFEQAQSLEFLYLIGLGAASIGNGKPTTCNGANLAYEKKAFYDVGGFTGIDDLASGDDELLLHKMSAKFESNIGFLKNKDAIVYTHAKGTLKEFIQQRKRWSSKSTRYKNRSIIILGIFVWLFNLSIIFNICMGLYNPLYLQGAIVQLGVKVIIEAVFLFGVTSFVNRRELLFLLPLVSIMHIFYIVYIGIAGNSGKYRWKGRLVR